MWAKQQLNSSDYCCFLRDARDYALINGLVIRNNSLPSDNTVAHIPFTLFPSPIPVNLYQQCLNLQPTIGTLMCKLANDNEFLKETLGPITEVDYFTRNLMSIHEIVLKEGQAQPIISCINRADYMLDKYQHSGLRVRQVEVNAIASSMSGHSDKLNGMHQFLMSKYGIKLSNGCSFPDNKSLELVAEGIISAFDAYGKSSSFVLLVGEERSLNFSDQLHIELFVHKRRPEIRFARRRFVDLLPLVRLGPNKELLLEDSKEIALVYFRYGYDPTNYIFDGSWELRLLIERSRAIKCPSINFHLSGAKKFQQVLNSSEKLERYLEKSDAQLLASTFCKFWPLDSYKSIDSEVNQRIENDASRLVLKPQREGGGHNIFGEDIKPFLNSISSESDLLQYILMEYIDSPREHNWLLLPEDSADSKRLESNDKLVSELGIFGSVLANGSQIISNRSAGYLVRSKKFGVNEGGVATGYAGISNILLIDDERLEQDFERYFEH